MFKPPKITKNGGHKGHEVDHHLAIDSIEKSVKVRGSSYYIVTLLFERVNMFLFCFSI